VSDCVLVVLLPCDCCSLRACCRLIGGVGVGVVVGVLVVVVVPVYGGWVGVLVSPRRWCVWWIFPHGPLVCWIFPHGLGVCVWCGWGIFPHAPLGVCIPV